MCRTLMRNTRICDYDYDVVDFWGDSASFFRKGKASGGRALQITASGTNIQHSKKLLLCPFAADSDFRPSSGNDDDGFSG